jgi:hypothetical protein
MAFKHGKDGAFLITDSGAVERNISAFVTGVDMTLEIDLPDTTTLGSQARRRGVVGLKDSSFSVTGFHDTTASTGSWTVLPALLGLAAASTFKWGPEGTTGGLPRITGTCRLRSYKTGSPVDGVVPFTAEFVGDNVVTVDTF